MTDMGHAGESVERRRATKPGDGEVAGFIILTAQPDGTWQPDWDGLLYVDADEAKAAYIDAVKRLGEGSDEDYLMLGEVIDIEVQVALPKPRPHDERSWQLDHGIPLGESTGFGDD